MERFRSSTRKSYWCVWRIFNKFFIKLDCKLNNWEDRIVLFVGFLVENGLKSVTVKSYLSAIRAVLLENKIKLNEDLFLLSSLTRACKLQNDRVLTRLPVQKEFLNLILQTCSEHFTKATNNQPYLRIMYTALLCTTYYSLFRVGEVTASPHVLLAWNIHIATNKKKMLFILITSKTHGLRDKPQHIKIKSNPVAQTAVNMDQFEVCPFDALQHLIKAHLQRMIEDEQFFIFTDKTPVQPHHLRNILHLVISKWDFRPTYIVDIV